MEDKRTLESWKEIAAYLNRSVMTCQRWEADLGLPVHRLDGTPKARVFAYTDEIDRWMEGKRRKHTKSRKKAVLAGAVVSLVALAAALFLWHPWSGDRRPSKSSSDRPSIAILHLANRTGQKDLNHYRDVLAAMISYDLSQSKYIYTVPADQVYSILTRLGLLDAENLTTENIRDIGRRAVAKYVASGFYAKAGERFLIGLTIHEAESGKVVGTEEIQAESVERFFAHGMNDLVRKIKPRLELTAVELANDIDSPLERVTSSSIEAYEYYLQAARLVGIGQVRTAIELLEKAVAIDPEFAMAYCNLATYHSNLANWVEWRRNNDLALELSKRQAGLPLREKLLIEGMATRDNEARVKIYSRLLEIYPEDFMGNFLMGVVYSRLDEPEKAAERYALLVGRKTEIPYPYHNLATVRCRMGDYAGAEKVLEDFVRDFPGHLGIAAAYCTLAQIYSVQAKYEPARAALDEALRLDPRLIHPVSRARGIVLTLVGDFHGAEAELQGILPEAPLPDLVYTHLYLAWIYKTEGKLGLAQESLRRGLEAAERNLLAREVEELAEDLIENDLAAGDIGGAEAMLSELSAWLQGQGQDPPDNIAWLAGKAAISSKKKGLEEAGRYAERYEAIIKKGSNRRAERYPLRLKGIIEMEKGDFDASIGLLLRAKSLLPAQNSLAAWKDEIKDWHAFFMEPLALAYFRSGDLKRARQEYEAITRLTTGRLAYGDVYARSVYMLGQISERLGKKRQALANYRKFLDLWKDADPIFPEIEDAKARLAKLEAK